MTAIYNPRKVVWGEHFRAEESGEAVAISEIGEASVFKTYVARRCAEDAEPDCQRLSCSGVSVDTV